MNPRDLLDVADELATGPNEAAWRSAISRAYYAAFHVARQLLEQCGFSPPRADQADAYLWLRLHNSGHADVTDAGGELNDLRQTRNWADYDLDQVLDQGTALKYVQAAIDLVHFLDTVAAAPAVLTRITEAMKTYERDVLRQVTWRV
jgi:uncharacterized protein (UPF0332 family)